MGDDGATDRPDLQALAVKHLGLEETEGVGLLMHDRDGRVVATNSAAEAILGLSSDQLRGRGAADPRWAVIDAGGLFVPTQRRPVVQALRTGTTVHDYVAGVHRPSVDATAEHVWLTGSCQPIFEPGARRPSGAISAFRVLGGVEGQLLRLSESERHYRWIAQHANDMVAVLATDTTHLWVSPSSLTLTGYTPDEMIGRTLYEFVHESDVAGVRAAVASMQAKGTDKLDLSFRLRCTDGRILWVESVGQSVPATDSESSLIRLATRDVSPRVAAEIARDEALAELRDSERRYKWIAENASEMVAVLAPDGTHLWLSPSCLAVTGYTPAELIGRTVWEFLHPDDVLAAGAAVDAVNLDSMKVHKLLSRFRHKDGHFVWVESIGHSAVSAGDDVAQIRVSTRDVTARVEAEIERDTALADLRMSERRYRWIAESASDMVSVLTADATNLWVSPSCLALTGYTADELVGRTIWEFVHPDDRPVADAVVADVQTPDDDQHRLTCRFRHKDGHYFWVESVGGSTTSGDDGALQIRASTRDVTARVEAETARDKALDELRGSERRFKWIAENSSDLVVVLGPDGTHLWVSPSSLALTGYSPEELVGCTLWEFMHPSDMPGASAVIEQVTSGNVDQEKLTWRLRHKDGHFVWVESSVHSALSEDGVLQIRVSSRDVTPRIAAENARDEALEDLRMSEQRYRWIAENASDMVSVLASDAKHLWVSPSSLALTGYAPEEIVGRTLFEFLHPSDIPAAEAAVAVVIEQRNVERRLITRFRHKDGHYLWVERVGQSADADDGSVQIRVSTRDVTSRIDAETDRDAALAEMTLLVDHAPIGMCVVDDEGRIVQANEALHQLTGYTAARLATLNFADLTHPDDAAATVADLASVTAGPKATSSDEKRYMRADGEMIWAERTVTRVVRAGSNRPLYIVQLLDLTDSRAHLRLAAMAMTDALTGLPNRLVLDDRLAHALTVARRGNTMVGVIFCDLDRFKQLNDTMGHEAGDDLLCAVADRIRATIRESDTAVRLGGDEFVVLCENVVDGGPVHRLASRLQASLDRPYELAAGTGDVSVSIGIAVGDGPTAAALLQQADESMYCAKRAAEHDIDFTDAVALP